MAVFYNILNILPPGYPAHSILEFANRIKSQHIPGLVFGLLHGRF